MKFKKNDKIILKKDIIVPAAKLAAGEEVSIVYVDKLLKTYDIENKNGTYITEVGEKDLC